LTDQIGEDLANNDLGGTATRTEQLADELSELSPEERQAAADALEQAAEALQNTNPEVSEQMQQAADALRNGDVQQAQQALNNAAQTLRQQETENRNNPQARAANQAADRLEQGRQELAQSALPGQSPQQQFSPFASEQGGQQSSQQSGQPQSAGQQSSSQQSGDQSQSGQGQQTTQQIGGQQTAGQGQPSDESGGTSPGSQEGSQAEQSGEGEQGAQEGGQVNMQGSAQQEGVESDQPQQGGGGAGNVGSPQGADNPFGRPGEQPGDVEDQAGTGETEMRDYDTIYSPVRIGGAGGPEVNLQGVVTNPEGDPVREGAFNEDFSGESRVPYNQVFRQYEASMQEALESDYIPILLRDVIKAYFSSLEP
jgi:hypothetical protein